MLSLKLNDSNSLMRVLREMVDYTLFANPRFLLIWKGQTEATSNAKRVFSVHMVIRVTIWS